MKKTKAMQSLNVEKTIFPITLEDRVQVKGKFLYYQAKKFYIKGVTYGTFKPQRSGLQYPTAAIVENDFRMMVSHGINCIRTYTVPPKYFLDLALEYDLKIMAGLSWEQHITFLDTAERKSDIIKRVREGVASCKQHPAILCYTIGNEIPASIVRWYGNRKIENFLKQLYKAVKTIDPRSLVTYVNFPTTEYLDLSFLDFDCFNVYLETPEKLSAYIARLHNLSQGRPLVLAEIGLDSSRNGAEKQAEVLAWQTKIVFAKGCAGMFVFAWTDEWWRGGFEIEDWDFGIVDRNRIPKPALFAVTNAMKQVPFENDTLLPFISVIVCTYNGSATIRDTLEGLQKLDYPNYEVIVVNDGSEDNTADIVKDYPVKLITTANMGLSSARNTGMNASEGKILAYIDDDAYPDIHWLKYLASAYLTSDHAGIGGPNLIPDEDGLVAKCVANSPGGPVHVLLSDEVAEHIPGCNMSFKKSALILIGGFNPIYRTAGDDVDVAWRIQNAGYTIGFHPSAVVWHHRRNSISAYWKQQKGYGKAEALLEGQWPGKYNGFGHLTWAGRIYGNGFTMPIKTKKDKVFYGIWGSALFQSLYQPADGYLSVLPLMPEWYLFSGMLGIVAIAGFLWAPLMWVWGLFFLSLVIIFIQAFLSASKNVVAQHKERLTGGYKLLITFLHVIQPLARLYGRLSHGLTPWRKLKVISTYKFAFVPGSKIFTHWSEQWRSTEDWLEDIEEKLISYKTRVKRGGDFDRWDILAAKSMFSVTRGLLAIEEHGNGKQLIKFKVWRTPSKAIVVITLFLAAMAVFAIIDGESFVAGLFIFAVLLFIIEYLKASSEIFHHVHHAFLQLNISVKGEPEKNDIKEEEPVLIQHKFVHEKYFTQPHSGTTLNHDN